MSLNDEKVKQIFNKIDNKYINNVKKINELKNIRSNMKNTSNIDKESYSLVKYQNSVNNDDILIEKLK